MVRDQIHRACQTEFTAEIPREDESCEGMLEAVVEIVTFENPTRLGVVCDVQTHQLLLSISVSSVHSRGS